MRSEKRPRPSRPKTAATCCNLNGLARLVVCFTLRCRLASTIRRGVTLPEDRFSCLTSLALTYRIQVADARGPPPPAPSSSFENQLVVVRLFLACPNAALAVPSHNAAPSSKWPNALRQIRPTKQQQPKFGPIWTSIVAFCFCSDGFVRAHPSTKALAAQLRSHTL